MTICEPATAPRFFTAEPQRSQRGIRVFWGLLGATVRGVDNSSYGAGAPRGVIASRADDDLRASNGSQIFYRRAAEIAERDQRSEGFGGCDRRGRIYAELRRGRSARRDCVASR